MDLGSGGVILARPVGSGYLPPNDSFVVMAAGKEGVFYVLDPNNMSNTVADNRPVQHRDWWSDNTVFWSHYDSHWQPDKRQLWKSRQRCILGWE
jgi:hypothetical protein